ncbi:hypothetical protein B0H17DRAFT_1295741 [Mycena rosella]|uniref:Uncharacterized protein n=1 Tax=Mycena rosella TaxID=1033263 RepID=A0AAD7DEJ2_MYCRO|nr:hypothetical protein B0H17DRAFT_1295741 [Mycena rosella]
MPPRRRTSADNGRKLADGYRRAKIKYPRAIVLRNELNSRFATKKGNWLDGSAIDLFLFGQHFKLPPGTEAARLNQRVFKTGMPQVQHPLSRQPRSPSWSTDPECRPADARHMGSWTRGELGQVVLSKSTAGGTWAALYERGTAYLYIGSGPFSFNPRLTSFEHRIPRFQRFLVASYKQLAGDKRNGLSMADLDPHSNPRLWANVFRAQDDGHSDGATGPLKCAIDARAEAAGQYVCSRRAGSLHYADGVNELRCDALEKRPAASYDIRGAKYMSPRAACWSCAQWFSPDKFPGNGSDAK